MRELERAKGMLGYADGASIAKLQRLLGGRESSGSNKPFKKLYLNDFAGGDVAAGGFENDQTIGVRH